MTLPTIEQVRTVATVTGDVLGALFALCTAIGNPLSKYTTGRFAAFGHLVLAFGADIGKARKRINELFSSSEPS